MDDIHLQTCVTHKISFIPCSSHPLLFFFICFVGGCIKYECLYQIYDLPLLPRRVFFSILSLNLSFSLYLIDRAVDVTNFNNAKKGIYTSKTIKVSKHFFYMLCLAFFVLCAQRQQQRTIQDAKPRNVDQVDQFLFSANILIVVINIYIYFILLLLKKIHWLFYVCFYVTHKQHIGVYCM